MYQYPRRALYLSSLTHSFSPRPYSILYRCQKLNTRFVFLLPVFVAFHFRSWLIYVFFFLVCVNHRTHHDHVHLFSSSGFVPILLCLLLDCCLRCDSTPSPPLPFHATWHMSIVTSTNWHACCQLDGVGYLTCFVAIVCVSCVCVFFWYDQYSPSSHTLCFNLFSIIMANRTSKRLL